MTRSLKKLLLLPHLLWKLPLLLLRLLHLLLKLLPLKHLQLLLLTHLLLLPLTLLQPLPLTHLLLKLLRLKPTPPLALLQPSKQLHKQAWGYGSMQKNRTLVRFFLCLLLTGGEALNLPLMSGWCERECGGADQIGGLLLKQ